MVKGKIKEQTKETTEALPKKLTAKKEQFSEWYNQITQLAGLIDKRYNVKGCFVWLNYGYEAMLNIKKMWDELFKKNGYKEMYFPLLVPVEYAEINNDWWQGFLTEAFWAKGLEEEKAKYVLRPTGEPAMYPMFSLWIRSWRDLPLRIYETVSSFRYETKHTRPIIRDREITVWHEIHTCHSTKNEAEEETKLHMKMWDKIWKKLCLPPLKVVKPKWEVFPGAVGAVEYYSVMPEGKAMENGSVNNLGQAYSKKFNITFKDKKEKEKFVWMTCTGNGARLLAAVIAVHGDDKGLILPPAIAPIQLIIVPIYKKEDKEKVLKKAQELKKILEAEGVRTEIDFNDEETPGAKYYLWEMKGVPLRIELGSREVKNKSVTIYRRDTSQKTTLKESEMIKTTKDLLKTIENNLLKNAEKQFKEKIVAVEEKEELIKNLENNKVASVYFCGEGKCWDEVKALKEGIELFGTDIEKAEEQGKCIICDKKTKIKGYVAHTY